MTDKCSLTFKLRTAMIRISDFYFQYKKCMSIKEKPDIPIIPLNQKASLQIEAIVFA